MNWSPANLFNIQFKFLFYVHVFKCVRYVGLLPYWDVPTDVDDMGERDRQEDPEEHCEAPNEWSASAGACLLYTSDAADE